VARPGALCQDCSGAWLAWLDWTLPPPPIRLITVGDTVREVGWRQEARYREWRDTVRFHLDLVERQCAEAGHCAVAAPRIETVALAGSLL
jgi:hypothetical protein